MQVVYSRFVKKLLAALRSCAPRANFVVCPTRHPSPCRSTMGAGALLAAYTAPRRILCSASQSDALVLLGLEDGSVRLWDVRSSAVVGGIERAHASRVRGMAILQEGEPDEIQGADVSVGWQGRASMWSASRYCCGG